MHILFRFHVITIPILPTPASALLGFKPVLTDLNVEIPRGTRTLLVGDNGAGKSTLLRILSGKHIHPVGSVTVLGRESL